MPSRFHAWGAPPPLPDVSAIPVNRRSINLPPTAPNAPADQPPPVPVQAPVQIFPWWLYEYESAQDFYIKSLNIAIAANATTPVPNFAFVVPGQNRGVLKHISMTLQSSTTAINLQLTLLLNNAPIQGWSGLAFPPMLATAVLIPFNDMNVRMSQNSVLTAQFVEASGLTWVVSLEASGWNVSEQDIARLQQGVRY